MTVTLKDRVLETSVSTGTGDFVLDGAQTGYQSFGAAVTSGDTVPYTIQAKNVDGSLSGQWEVGVGTYVGGTNSIARTTVLDSSEAGAKVTFAAGDKDIFLDLPGELVVQGAASSTEGHFASFSDNSGKDIADSGYSASSFVLQTEVGAANGVASLDGSGKVPLTQIPALGDLNYQGTWNASTNSPTLTSSTGTKGYYYVVSVAGSTNLDGITDWQVGDWAVFNGSVWQKIDNTDAVTSVNGQTGTVVLTASDVGAQPAGTYVTSVSGTAPVVSSGGTTPAISMHVADSTHDGYLSSTDWSTFNSKVTMTYPAAGIPNSTGTAWGTSYTTTGTGTIVALQTNPTLYNPNIDVIDFDTAYATTLTAGQMGWDGNNTLGIGMAGGNVIQRIGEDAFIYVKASSAITKGQLCMFTGVVGASSLITAAPSTGITNGQYIVGVAAESIALNGFGLIQVMGNLKGLDTSAFVDGDILYYNSAVTGGFTTTFPTSGPIVTVAAVTHAGNGGSGSLQIRISVTQRITAGTGISVSQTSSGTAVTNSAPDQTVSITGAGGAVVTGTYPNFTITTPSGTVTSVTATAPLASTGGATPNLTITQASGSTNGYLSSTDWTTFNSKGSGTVTSVGGTGTVNGITLTGTVTSSGSLTLGGTLSGVSLTTQVSGTLPIANGGTNQTSYTSPVSSIAGLVWFDGTSFQNDSSTSHVGYNPSTNTFYANNAIVGGTATFNNTATFNGTSSTFGASLLDANETVNIVAAAPSATTNFYIQSGAVQYYTSNAANNWTLNIAFSSGTALNTALATGQSVTFTLVTTQNSTAYYANAITIDGTSVTPKWVGGAPTGGNASGLDVYRFAIIKTANAAYTVIASLTQYK